MEEAGGWSPAPTGGTQMVAHLKFLPLIVVVLVLRVKIIRRK